MKRVLLSSLGGLLTGIASAVLSPSAFGQIEITEVMYDASVDDVWEWIEIRNTGASAVNLDGYYAFNLGDNLPAPVNPSILSSLDPDTTINPGEMMIIYDAFYATGNPNNFATDNQFRSAWGIDPSVKVLGAQFWPAIANTPGGPQQSIGFWPTEAAWNLDRDGGGVTTSFANATFGLDFANFPVTGTVNGQSSITWTGNNNYQDGSQWVQSVTGSAGAVTSVQTVIGTGSDAGNPGIVSNLGTPSPGLYFTEIMYDPSTDSAAPLGEWVELYNNTGATINLAGYVLDDFNATGHAAANIAGGSIPNGGVGILFNGDLQTAAEFESVWGPGLNLIPVTDWTNSTMSLNNNVSGTTGLQDRIALWDSFEDYTATATEKSDHNLAIAKQEWNEGTGFPSAVNASISLGSLDDASFPRAAGASWVASALGDQFGSFLNSLRHPGGDVGSPGTFQVQDPGGQDGDFDGDGDVDGRDFLVWQRGGSPNALSAGDLALWQDNYGAGGLAAISAVPEPGSLALFALALVPVACRRKR